MAKKAKAKKSDSEMATWPSFDPSAAGGSPATDDFFVQGGLRLFRASLPGGNRSLRTVKFSGEDPDGKRRNVKLRYKPSFMLALSMITTNFDNPFKPHGGLIGGYADFSGRRPAQFSLGPVVHLVAEGTKPEYFRMAAVGPETATGADVGNQHGVALSLLQLYGPERKKELILVRVRKSKGHNVGFELRRAVDDSYGEGFDNFNLDCYFVFFS